MKNNKGYSLVELLASLAVFMIVMVSIVSLMRTASVTFKNENYEVKVEKDSQIVMAQIEDMLVDCRSITKNYGNSDDPSGDKMYSFSDADGNHSIKYVKATKTLEYLDVAGGSSEVLASGVTEFSITGLKSEDSLLDNSCVLSLTMALDSKGNTTDTADGVDYKYSGDKTIAFRNNIDGADLGLPDLENTVGGGGTGGAKQIEMGRYQVVNLTSMYDIVTVTSFVPNGTNGYAFCDPSKVNPTTKGLDSVQELPAGTYSPYITTNSVCNGAGGSSFGATLTGITSKNETLTVNIITKQVKMLQGNGFLEMPSSNINNTTSKGGGGFYTYIEMEGICLPDYYKYYGGNATGKIEVSLNGANKGTFQGTLDKVSSQNINFGGQIQLGLGDLPRLENVGMFYDVNSPNYVIIKYHNGCYPNNTSVLDNNKLNYKVSLTIPQGTYSETFRVYCGGSSMKNLE